MTTIRTTLAAIGFMTLGAMGTASVTAMAERGGHGSRGSGHHFQMLLDGVELTESQEGLLEEMKSDMRAEREEHRSERGERGQTLVSLLESDTIDRQAMYDRIDEKLAERRELHIKRADFMMDFIETLDADQKAAMLDNLDELEARRDERREGAGEDDERRRPRGR